MNVNLSVCTEDKTFIIKQYVQNVQSSFDKIIQNKPKCFCLFCCCKCQEANHWTSTTSAILEHFPKEIPEKCVKFSKGFLNMEKTRPSFVHRLGSSGTLPYSLIGRSIIVSDRFIIDIINSISHINLVPNVQNSIHFSICSVHQQYISFEVQPISFVQVYHYWRFLACD